MVFVLLHIMIFGFNVVNYNLKVDDDRDLDYTNAHETLGHIEWCKIDIWGVLYHSSFSCFGTTRRRSAHPATSMQNVGISRPSNSLEWRDST